MLSEGMVKISVTPLYLDEKGHMKKRMIERISKRSVMKAAVPPSL